MLCSRFKQILFTQTALNNNVQYRCIVTTRLILKQCRIDEILASIVKNKKEVRIMSSLRFILRDIGVNKLKSVWNRSMNIGNVVKRYRRDRIVRDVIIRFRQTFFPPRRTLLLSATAAYKAKGDDDGKPPSYDRNITDQELESLQSELDAVEDLSRTTLYCTTCNRRLVIEKKQPGIGYCICKEPRALGASRDGWEPYMEAENVVIWRKEYKPGQGLYAYKVYGRYRDVTASHFAAVQVDNGYRREWDSAVAALAVVERSPSVPDQAVLHWEVLWPRLFANRDYVYIRRHKEYDVVTTPRNLLEAPTTPPPSIAEDRPSVHSNAKRKAMEDYSRVGERQPMKNKVYVVVSRSCEHPSVPETKHAIRVNEYWSDMVVRTIDGADNPGMEFVLTYYDEPAVGGLPTGVAAWATGRAAPAYLAKMRLAARDYTRYRRTHHQDAPDFLPLPKKLSYEEEKAVRVNEQDMESSKQGPEMENGEMTTKDESTQTDDPEVKTEVKAEVKTEVKAEVKTEVKVTEDKFVEAVTASEDKAVETDLDKISSISDSDKDPEQEEPTGRWWRYLHPFHYFV